MEWWGYPFCGLSPGWGEQVKGGTVKASHDLMTEPCCWCCEVAWDVVCVVSLEPAQGAASSHGSGRHGRHQPGNLSQTDADTSASSTCVMLLGCALLVACYLCPFDPVTPVKLKLKAVFWQTVFIPVFSLLSLVSLTGLSLVSLSLLSLVSLTHYYRSTLYIFHSK